jgi:hypothetical protein
MTYFKEKKELGELHEFRDLVSNYFCSQDRSYRLRQASEEAMYGGYLSVEERNQLPIDLENEQQELGYLRTRIARTSPRINNLVRARRIPASIQSFPAPAIGGPILNVNIFDSLLHDPTINRGLGGGVPRQMVVDVIDRAIGVSENRCADEWKHLVNPFYWLKVVFLFVLRLPANLIQLSGFDVSKFEEHFWGKLFQLVWIISLIGFLIWLGFAKTDVIEVIKGVVSKGE